MGKTLREFIEDFKDDQEFCIEAYPFRGTKYYPLVFGKNGSTFDKKTVPFEFLDLEILEVVDLETDLSFKFIALDPESESEPEPRIRGIDHYYDCRHV